MKCASHLLDLMSRCTHNIIPLILNCHPVRFTRPTKQYDEVHRENRTRRESFSHPRASQNGTRSPDRSGCKKSRRNLVEDRVWIGARENPRPTPGKFQVPLSPRFSPFAASLGVYRVAGGFLICSSRIPTHPWPPRTPHTFYGPDAQHVTCGAPEGL